MMTISEFANKVNLSVDIILNICKNLDINVDSSDDLLSEDDIELLYDELENISFSHQGNSNSSSSFFNGDKSNNSDNVTDKNSSGGGSGPDNNVEIDKESLNNGISKIKTLKDNLDTLKSTLDGITVKSPIDSSLLSNCKHYAAEAINISDSMSDRINKVASLIYDDDEMFGYLFENGLFFDDGKLDIDAIREYLKNENLSQENIENLDDYMKLRDELANKYSNGEFTKRDKDGYLYQDLSKLEQLVLAGGFSMGMFSDFSSGMVSYNKQIDGIKNQNKEKDEEAKKIKVDKNSKSYGLGMRIVSEGYSYDSQTNELYDNIGRRVILEDSDVGYRWDIDSKKYVDDNENEVVIIDDLSIGSNTTYDTENYNLDENGNSINVEVGNLRNCYELNAYNVAINYLAMKELEKEQPTIDVSTNIALDYLSSKNIEYKWDIESKKYIYLDGSEIFPKNENGTYKISDIEEFSKYYDTMFKEKQNEYLSVKTNPVNLLYEYMTSDSRGNFDSDTVIGGYYYDDQVKDSNGNLIKVYGNVEDISNLSSTERNSLEIITIGDVVKEANLEDEFSELYSSTYGTFISDDADKFIEKLGTSIIDVSKIESEYLTLKGNYTSLINNVSSALFESQIAFNNYYKSHDFDRVYNSYVNNEKLEKDYLNILSGYTYTSYSSDGISGSGAGNAVLKLKNKDDIGVLYTAVANGLAKVTSDGRLYYEDKGIYVTVENSGIDIQTWNEFSKVLSTSNVIDVVNSDKTIGFGVEFLNNIKKSILSEAKLTEKDYANLDNNEVVRKISEFKNNAFTVMEKGNLSVYANEEYSKYILNSVLNGSNEFKLDGNKVTYVDSKTGRTLYVYSEDNCLELALNEINNKKNVQNNIQSYLNSDFINKYVNDYNYLNEINFAYNTSGGSSVFDVVNDRNFANTLNSRAVGVKEAFDKEFADKYPVDASLFSIPLGLIEGSKTFVYATEKAFNDSNDTPIYSVNTYSSGDIMRGRVGENIKMSELDDEGKPTKKAEFESLFYSTTMSMADNLFNSAVFGSLGMPMGIGLAFSSFDNSYNDAISRGINQKKSYVYSLLLAGLEGATEQMSWDNLSKVTGSSWTDDAIMNVFNNKLATVIKGENGELLYSVAKGITGVMSQAGSEGFEELVSSVGGRFIDNVMNGDKSTQFLRYQELTSQGISSEKAMELIALENLDEDLQSVVSGMMSGGMMSGGGITLNSVSSDGQFRNALEYNFANGNYDTSLNYINEYLSTSSKGIILDTKFKSDLENAFVNQDFNSVINQILNNSSISLDIKNKVSSTIINTLSSTNQIDENNAKDLLSKVEEYNKKVQENNKKIQEKIEKVREQIHSEMKSKLKEKGINPRNMSLETMIKKYPDIYKEVSNNLNKKNNENSDVIEHKDGERTSFDELGILGAMQVRLDSMGINTEGMTLDDMKTKYFDIYQEVVESFNRDNSLSNDTNNTNDGESVDLSNIDLLSSFVDGHFKISLVDDMINLEGNDIIYRFSKDNVDAILKKYEGKNLNDDIVKEQFDNDLKLIENVDIVHKGEIVNSNPETVVRTGVAGALGAGIISGIGNTNTSNDGVSIDGNSNNGNQQNTSGSNINVNVVSSNSNDSNNSTGEKVNNQNGVKNIDLDKKEFIAKYLSTEVKTNFANFLKSIVNSSKRKTFNISKLNSLIDNFNSLIDSYSYYLSEQIKHDISLNSDNVGSSNLNLYNNLIADLKKIFESNEEFFERLNSKFDENVSELISNMENFFESIRISYNQNVKNLQDNLKDLKDNISVKINNLFNKINNVLNSYNDLFNNYENNDVITSVDMESMKRDIDKIISFHNSRYSSNMDALNRLKLFADSKSSDYGNYNLITSSNGARELLMKYTPDQVAEYLFNLEQSQSISVENNSTLENNFALNTQPGVEYDFNDQIINEEVNEEKTFVEHNLNEKILDDGNIDGNLDEFRPVNLSDVKVEHEENINKNVVDNIENLGARENNKFDFNQNVNISMFKNSNELIDYLRQKSLSESNIEWDKKVLSLYLEYIKENGFKYSLGALDIFDVGTTDGFEIYSNTFNDGGTGKALLANPENRYTGKQLLEMKRGDFDFRITLNNSSNIKTSKAIKYVNVLVDECQKRNIDISMKNYWLRDAIILYCYSDQLHSVVELLEDLTDANKYGDDVSSVTKEFGPRKPFTIGLNNNSYYGISMAHLEYICKEFDDVPKFVSPSLGYTLDTYSGYTSSFLKNAYEKLLNKYDGDSSKITVDEFYDELFKYHKKYMFGDENSTENIPLWMHRRNYQELVGSGVHFNGLDNLSIDQFDDELDNDYADDFYEKDEELSKTELDGVVAGIPYEAVTEGDNPFKTLGDITEVGTESKTFDVNEALKNLGDLTEENSIRESDGELSETELDDDYADDFYEPDESLNESIEINSDVQSSNDGTMVEEYSEDLLLSNNSENNAIGNVDVESLSLIDKLENIIEDENYSSLTTELSFDERLDLLNSILSGGEINFKLIDILTTELVISNLFNNEEIVQIFSNQTEYDYIIVYMQDMLILKINNFDYDIKKSMFDNIMYSDNVFIKNKCSFLLSFGAFDQLSLFSSLNEDLKIDIIFPLLSSSNENMILRYFREVDLSLLDIDKLKNIINSKLSNIGKKEFYDIIKETDLEKEFFTKISEEQIEELIHNGRRDLNTMLSNFEYEYGKIVSNYKRNVTARIIDCVKDEMRGISESRLEEWVEYYLTTDVNNKLEKHLEEIQNSFDIYFRMFVNDIRNDISLEKAVAKYSENVIELVNGNQSRLSGMIDDCNYEFIYNIVRRIDNFYNENNSSKFDEILENIKYSLKRVVAREGSSLDTEYHSMIEKNLDDNIRRLNDYVNDIKYELKDGEKLDIGLQFFGGKGDTVNSKLFGNIFSKSKNNGGIVSQQLGDNLFNIDDIRNGKNIVSVDSIKNVDNMSRDELNKILSFNRYNSNQKKSAILSIYLRDMNLSFSTDSVDTIYNQLLYKLSDKNIDSVERNKVLEILRSITVNSNGKYKSIDTLVDYQFKEKPKKDILDTKKRNSEFDLEDFYSSNSEKARGAVIYFSDNQVVSMLNDKNGAGSHDVAWEDIVSSVYGIDYVHNKNGAKNLMDIGNSILRNYMDSGIQMRLVSEGDSTPQYIVIFPNKISRNQYNLFKAYVDKYGDTLSKISHDLDEKGMIYGVDGLIYCWAANMQGHNLSDLLEYAESLVDDSIKLPTEKNIVGETLEDLVSSIDVGSELSYYDDSMFYLDDVYEENASKNGDNSYELKGDESLRSKIGIQFFGGNENELQVQSNNETKKVNNQQNDIQHKNIWDTNINDKFTYLTTYEEFMNFIKENGVDNLFIRNKQYPNDKIQCFFDRIVKNSDMCITVTDELHLISIFDSFVDGKTVFINPSFFERYQEQLKTDLKNIIIEKVNTNSPSISIPDILIDDDFVNLIVSSEKFKNTKIYISDVIGNQLTQEQIDKIKKERLYVVYDNQQISTNRVIGYHTITDLKNIKSMDFLEFPNVSEIENFVYLRDDCIIRVSGSLYKDERLFLDELKKMCDILKNHNRTYNIKIKVENRELLRQTGILSYSNLNFTIENDLYEYSKDEYLKEEAVLDNLVKPIKDSDLSPYEKYLAVYNIVKQFKPYMENNEDKAQSRYLRYILNNEYMVCVGYAKLLEELLNKIEIPVIKISAAVDISKYNDDLENVPTDIAGHARNLVKIDDDKYNIHGYYVVDSTWDNDMSDDLYLHSTTTFDRRKESRRLEKMQNEDLLFDFHNFEEFSEKINYYLKKEFNSRNKENKLYSRNENYNEVVVHSYKNVYDKILELLIKLDYSEYHALYNKYDSLIQEKLELLKNKKVDSLKEIEEVFSEFLTDYAKYIIPLSNQKVDDNIIIEAASNVKREIYNFTEEDLEIWKKATIDINKNIEMYSFPYVYDSSSERKNYLYTRSLNSDSSSTNMNDGNNLLSSDTINSLSIQERQNVENFLGKVISSVTVNEYERYELVVKTADKILENVPEGYFKDENEKRQFLFGIETCSDSIGYTASELRDRFNLAKQSGEDLLEIILSDVDDAKGVDVEVLKVYGLYNIVYAMNQFVLNSGIKVGDGELPVDKIAAINPVYYDGAYDQIKSILDGHLQSAETNYKKVTDDLVEIAGLVNGSIKGYDKNSTKRIDYSLKKEPSAIRKVYNDWYSRLEEYGFRVEIVENNADRKFVLKGIKKHNIGQSFILTEDGYVKTLDGKDYGIDEKGNIVKVIFSDFIPKDLLRYTIISDTSSYVSTFNDTVKMLEDKGYEVIDSNLSWPGSFYRGINLSLRDSETSQIFELQFHTEESFYAKNEGTHSFYEVKRNKKFNDDNKKSPIQKVADYAQILVQSQVDVPVNAEKIGFIKDFIKSVLKNKKGIDLSRMNEIIHIINKLNREYVYGTDEYKSAMREYVKSISVDSKFSLSEFLSEYFKIDTVSSMDSRTGVVSLEIVSDIDDVASSWVEDEDLGIDEEDGYELKDGESLAGRIGTQFFGGTLNNKDSFNSQLSLFSQLVESVGNNDLFSQILDQIKNLKEIELVGFKTLDEYKSYIIDYFISTNFEGLTPKQFWLLTMDKFMLKKMIGTEALNKFILDYYGIAYGNLAETFNLLDVKSLNQIFNNPEIKEYIFGLSVDVFIKSINAFCEYSNYTWLQCDTFIEKIMNMSYDELYIFMEKTNYKKINLIEKVFDSGDYESCLKLLHFIENKCLNVETLLKYPKYRLMLSDFYPFVYGNEELRRMHNKQEQVKDEFEKKIISLLNENLDDVLLSDGYRIANLDMHSVYVVKYELNGNIMQWEIFTENKNYINMRNAIDKNDIHKAIISKNFKLLSIQKDEFASSLILSSENGLVEGINKVRLKINGVEKQILVNYTGYSDINLSDRFSNVSSIEIIGVQSVESKNVILDDGVGMYEITYVENGILNKTYLTPTHKSLWDEDYVLKIDDYFIENNIVDATDIQIRKVDIQEIDLSSLSISKYSSSYDIFANNKYGGNQSDVRKLVIDFINGTEMNFVSSEKAKCILNLIDKYFPNSSDIDKINLVVAFEQVGCGYIAVANAFCTYMGSLENGFEIFKEKFGFDLYVLENGKKYFNVEAVAFDILCSEFIHQDIKSIINENKIEGVNSLNFVVMMQNYFNDKSIFVKASTGNYIKNKNETKINLLSKNIFPSKSSFKILSASNFDMELMSLGANSFISNDGSLNNTEIVGNVIEGIGGHAMIITDVADDGNLIVSSWNKKYKFISESIDKYIKQEQKSKANVWTIEFDIGE